MRLYSSPLNLCSVCQQTQSKNEASRTTVPCHASVRHNNFIYRILIVFGQLLHFRRLLPAARGSMQLHTLTLITRLQRSTIKSTLVLCSCVLNSQPCSVSTRFLLKPMDTHTGTQTRLRHFTNSSLLLLTPALTNSALAKRYNEDIVYLQCNVYSFKPQHRLESKA